MNNFQQLQQKHINEYEQSGATGKKNVEGMLSSFKFIASIIEVYLPKLGNLLIAFSGGTTQPKTPSSTPPNLQDRENRRSGQ